MDAAGESGSENPELCEAQSEAEYPPWAEGLRSLEPIKVEADADSDDGDEAPLGRVVDPTLFHRPIFCYHAVVNTAVELQLLEFCGSPCCLYLLVSKPFQAAGVGDRPAFYREAYFQSTVPIEVVRTVMPGVPNIGYVFSEFAFTAEVDEEFRRAVQQRWSAQTV